MTTEEKAKAYDEALERMKHVVIVPKSEEALQALKETIFPELKESEDEKIRKGLIDIFNTALGQDFLQRKAGLNRDKVITYLEKQKELDKMIVVSPEVWDNAISDAFENGKKEGEKQKKQNDDTEEYTDFTIYHPLKNGKGEYECISYSFYGSLTSFSEDKDLIDFLHTCFCTKEECEEWIEKQKEEKQNIGICPHSIKSKSYSEQKPAEYITDAEMKRSMDSLHDFKVFAANLAKQFNITHKRDIDWHNFCAGLLTYLERNKPAEWSENDKRILGEAIGMIEARGCWVRSDDAVKQVSDFLKSLPERFSIHPKQEWSEEDWEALDIAIINVEDMPEEDVYAGHRMNFGEVARRLKSLRPQFHWKPSKEQMEALKNIAYGYYQNGDGPVFRELYDNLKKL